TVTSNVSDFPATTVSASASTNPDAPDGAAPNKFAGALSVATGIFHENANAYISSGASVDAQGAINVTASSDQPYSWQLLGGINIVELFLSKPKHTTDDGSQSVANGDTVLVKGGHTAGGDEGELYQNVGAAATIDLAKEDFTNTNRWTDLGSPAGYAARTFIANFSGLLT